MIQNINLRKLNIIIGLLVAVTLLVLPAVSVQAADPVKLSFNAGSLTPWNIGPIVPGDSGIKTVIVQNIGSSMGYLTIWLDNVVNTDGTPAEFETQAAGDPGELGNYLTLSLTSSRITSKVGMPALVSTFPQSAAAANYIRVNGLAANESVTLTWGWRLPAGTGNIVQGDSLSFDIHYLLEDTPPPEPGGGGGYGGSSGLAAVEQVANPIRVFEISWQDTVTNVGIGTGNLVTGSHVISTLDGQVTLTISENSRILTDSQADHILIKVEPRPVSVEVPGGFFLVGQVYDIVACDEEGQPVNISIWPQLLLTIKYDPQDLPPGTTNVYINTFDEELQRWVRLPKPEGYIDKEGEAVGLLSHFSRYAAFAETEQSAAVPVLPSRFLINSLSVSPRQIQVGDNVIITGDVVNTGGTAGTYVIPVNIPGLLQTIQKTTLLKPGEIYEYRFIVKADKTGTYQVQVGSRTVSFTVEAGAPLFTLEEPNYRWILILAAISVLVFFFWLLFLRRRRPTDSEI